MSPFRRRRPDAVGPIRLGRRAADFGGTCQKSIRKGRAAMEFKMGVPVMASDGRVGTLEGLIFDPSRREVTGLVVKQGFLLPRDVVVPVERVTEADEEGVRVEGTAAEIGELPGFSQSQYTAPPQNWLP